MDGLKIHSAELTGTTLTADIELTLSADAWQLLSDVVGADDVADKLNVWVEKSFREGVPAQATEAVITMQKRWAPYTRKYGAFDAEVRMVLGDIFKAVKQAATGKHSIRSIAASVLASE